MALELIKFWLAKTGIECLVTITVVVLLLIIYTTVNKTKY